MEKIVYDKPNGEEVGYFNKAARFLFEKFIFGIFGTGIPYELNEIIHVGRDPFIDMVEQLTVVRLRRDIDIKFDKFSVLDFID